jgi:hypothetical protein
MIINNTITDECFLWCKEQSFIHSSNLTIEGIGIVVLALIVLSIRYVYYLFEDFIKIDEKEKLKYIIDKAPDFAILLLIGFLIWFVYFA